MSRLLQEIDNFKQRADAHWQEKEEQALMQIAAQVDHYEKFIAESEFMVAMTDLDKLTDFQPPKSVTIPPELRFGHLFAYSKNGKPLDKIHIPMILPIADTNAVLFDMKHLDKDVPEFFQAMALRFLLSMQLKVCRFYMIDKDFGASFKYFSTLKNPMLQREVFHKQEDINKLMTDLAKIVSLANQDYLSKYPNLTAHNAQPDRKAQPYHFVFINDFPYGFQPHTLDALFNLINNNNATKAGIYIFINYNRENDAPRDFDIERFKKICACISSNPKGDILLENWGFNIQQPVFKIVADMALPHNKDKIADFINNTKEEKVSYSLEGWIDDLKTNGQIWQDTMIGGINVPVGFVSPTEYFNFYLANDNDSNCLDFFALVAGRPRMGKTELLHNVIVNACMKYSPEELNLYLVDFANGASFSIYRDLPHAKALMLSNNREYALRILEHVKKEADRRARLYQQAVKKHSQRVTTFASYRKVTGEQLPRIVILMDEFHFLFNSVDMVSIKAKEVLCDGIRQWGKFGINIILCTQDLSGVNFGDADSKITYRFALNLVEADSRTVIRNSAAKSLTRKGQIIMNNTTDGRIDANVEFQCAYTLPEPRHLEHTRFLAGEYKNRYGEAPLKYICEEGTYADMAENIPLMRLIADDHDADKDYCLYLGKPDLLRDTHTRIRYRRQNSHALYIGEDFATAINSIAVSLLQIQKQSHPDSKFYVIDCFNAGDEFQGALNGIENYSPDNFTVSNALSVVDTVNRIAEELEKRSSQKMQQSFDERMVLVVLNTQNCDELRPQGAGIMTKPSETTTKLVKILGEGAQLGIHCIMHSLSYSSLVGTGNIFESRVMNHFENKIFLKGADIQNIFIGGSKIPSVEENGLMIVLNNRLDGETYEQCKSYSEITANSSNAAIDFLSKLFEKNAGL